MISVVIPLYNERAVLPELARRLTAVIAGMAEPVEVVLVDDGSTDGTRDQLVALHAGDPRFGLVFLSRNFGHQTAITAGLAHAKGEAVVVMDGDLQDPPELIPALVARFREGVDVVYAVRAKREGESWFKRSSAALFYRTLSAVAELDIPPDVGDFRLMSRRVVDALGRLPERHRYVRGLVRWVGFVQGEVRYTRDARFAGTTKYPLSRMVRLAADAIFSFTTLPLRLATLLGFGIATLCVIYALYATVMHVVYAKTLPGWTSTVVSTSLLGAVQLVCMGIIGEYVGRIFDEAKRRPLYFVELHCPPAASEAVVEGAGMHCERQVSTG